MKDQEINIAIAEACGWTNVAHNTVFSGRKIGRGVFGNSPSGGEYRLTPNYCNDLNAIHGAIMSLDGALRDHSFRRALAKTVGVIQFVAWESSLICLDKITNATARQRAEAFLRTIGK